MSMNFRMKFLLMRMKKIRTWLSGALLLLCVCLPGFAAIPARPSPPRLVNDLAGLFTTGQTERLERMLTAFDDSTSNQIAVVTVKDLEGYAVADYAVRIGLEWGVGSKDFNNGIVVLVKPKNETGSGQVSIQIGYGLEGAIPDATAGRIIRDDMIPHFREDDYYGGVSAACEKLMAYARGEISAAREKNLTTEDIEAIVSLLLTILFFIIVIVLVTRHKGDGNNSGGRNGTPPHIFFGPVSGGSRGGGFGSFGGGGFGGFGGGSFGGGGASGSW